MQRTPAHQIKKDFVSGERRSAADAAQNRARARLVAGNDNDRETAQRQGKRINRGDLEMVKGFENPEQLHSGFLFGVFGDGAAKAAMFAKMAVEQ